VKRFLLHIILNDKKKETNVKDEKQGQRKEMESEKSKNPGYGKSCMDFFFYYLIKQF